ncbi:TetR/AcrR family transcriptional regulator [Pseudomonas sp. NPDC096917]|uniref:TetR/AcrR family transcriptional regulator n=1 Tax=Pseudomonas sp. NPDC096917 TaxID=3364483 RepID=UPI00383A2B29
MRIPSNSCAPDADQYIKREVQRQSILELYATRGFGQVSMRELASHLRVTPGAIYHHYPSKQHLLFDFIEELYEDLTSRLSQPEPIPADPIDFIVSAHLDLYVMRPFHFKIALRDAQLLEQEHRDDLQRLSAQYYDSVCGILGLKNAEQQAGSNIIASAIIQVLISAPEWINHELTAVKTRRELLSCMLNGAIGRLLKFHNRRH